jgi:hypothetical protein
MEKGITFRQTKEPLALIGHADADWANSTEDRKSISGYCFRLNPESSIISWKSKRQPIVALSSCEAEYISLTIAMQETLFLKQLMKTFTNDEISATLYGDNQGALKLAHNPAGHTRTKYIDVRYHFIRDIVNTKQVELKYIPTNENDADMFTKSLVKQLFTTCGDRIFL